MEKWEKELYPFQKEFVAILLIFFDFKMESASNE